MHREGEKKKRKSPCIPFNLLLKTIFSLSLLLCETAASFGCIRYCTCTHRGRRHVSAIAVARI